VYVVITLGNCCFGYTQWSGCLVTDVTAKRAPTTCSVWKSHQSHIVQYFHTNCDHTQSVML
jgi:hypothetical protein